MVSGHRAVENVAIYARNLALVDTVPGDSIRCSIPGNKLHEQEWMSEGVIFPSSYANTRGTEHRLGR